MQDDATPSRFRRARTHVWAAVWLFSALLSIFVVAPFASSPSTLSGLHDSLDQQQTTVTGLALGATGIATTLSLAPDDYQPTPVIEKLVAVSGWFVVIIVAIILQKILVTVAGSIAFIGIVPLACALAIAYVYSGRSGFRSIALRFAALGVVLFAAIPASIWVSSTLTATYSSVSAAAAAGEQEPAADADEDTTSDDGLFGTIGGWIADVAENIGSAVKKTTDDALRAVDSFTQEFALLLVTTCVMPILVMLLFSWVIKLLFGVDLGVSRVGRGVQSSIAGVGARMTGSAETSHSESSATP